MHKFLLTAGLILISVNVFAENLYYIYKDNKGRTFIEDTVTPNHAKYGYRIVNSQGATLQVVPGTLEKQREEKKRLAHKKTKKPHKKEHSKDEYLLRTFVDEEDIRQTGNKKILALQTQIETTNQHISAFEKNLVQLEEQIQTMDQAGKEITDKQVDDIRRIKDSIAKNKAFVLRKIKQQQEIRDEYLGYIERFKALKAQQAKQ